MAKIILKKKTDKKCIFPDFKMDSKVNAIKIRHHGHRIDKSMEQNRE